MKPLKTKLIRLKEAVELIQDGSKIALGGNTLHRSPSAIVREIARQRKKDLEVIKTAGAYDIDLLCAAGCISAVSAGFVGYENEFGLAPGFRKAAEEGRIQVKENSCYTVIAGLRAAAYGIPFQPTTGLSGSQLPEAAGFKKVQDPYSGMEVYIVPALRPDWAVLHVQECDPFGNARIYGTVFEDVLMASAAKAVILSTEKVISSQALSSQPELTKIPGLFVRAVVELKGGAYPCSCYPYYDYDREHLRRYLELSKDKDHLEEYLYSMDAEVLKSPDRG